MSNLTSMPTQEPRRQGVTFTLGDCDNRLIHGALAKLDEYTGFSGADISRFNKIKNAYDAKSKQATQFFKKLISKHAEHEPCYTEDKDGNQIPMLNAKGKQILQPIMIPKGRGMKGFLFKDNVAFNKDYQELMGQTFEVKATLLLTEDLMKAGLTPKEIRACAKIVSDIDPELIQDTPIEDRFSEDEDEMSQEPVPYPKVETNDSKPGDNQ